MIRSGTIVEVEESQNKVIQVEHALFNGHYMVPNMTKCLCGARIANYDYGTILQEVGRCRGDFNSERAVN